MSVSYPIKPGPIWPQQTYATAANMDMVGRLLVPYSDRNVKRRKLDPGSCVQHHDPEFEKFIAGCDLSSCQTLSSLTPVSSIPDRCSADSDRFSWQTQVTPNSISSNHHGSKYNNNSVAFSSALPDRALRHVNYGDKNPFEDGAGTRYDNRIKPTLATTHSEVNGYLKFHHGKSGNGSDTAFNPPGRSLYGTRHCGPLLPYGPTPNSVVRHLPSDFGKGLLLEQQDRKLFTFYLTAYCRGRTLIPEHNFWLKEIAPMADSSPLVLEAVLALAGSYVLDYVSSPGLVERTNRHYYQASTLISQALRSPEYRDVDRSGPLIAALILLEADDEVIYELRRPKDEIPNFHRGNLLARDILDQSDPGYRYWQAHNVQYTKSWVGMSACVAVGCILVEMMSPSPTESYGTRDYGWLLGGSEEDVHTIYGAKGFSPKLINMLARITQILAEELQMSLDRLQQRSKYFDSLGRLNVAGLHNSTDELLSSCILNDDGRVFCPMQVTRLAGEAWLCAAKIYLHSRLLRKPPTHTDVRQHARALTQCIEYLPDKGPLLTAQSPFLPVFLMAIVAHDAKDRDVATKWFQTVISRGGRSNVPPVWDATQKVWEWLDENIYRPGTLEFDDRTPLGQRRDWWEEMVEYLRKEVGLMSLT